MMILISVISVFLLIGVILFFIPGRTPSIKDERGHILKGSIASLEKITLGGQKQWILIRGADATKPIILFLHGGPGTSDMGLMRRHTSELEKHFVVVTWDQRGACKSFSAGKPNSSMTISQMVSDIFDLTEMLRNRFNKNKIILAGHSWGSILGVLTVHKYPELFSTYIGINQAVNMPENERISYEWTLEQAIKANDKQAVKKLTEIGKPPYIGKWQKKFMTERRLLGKFGGEFYGSSKGAFPVVIGSMIRATEYTLLDKINFFRGIFASVRLLGPELMKINLTELVQELKVPVYFLLGRHDYEAPFMIAEEYFNLLRAPMKKLVWFENSAHMLSVEDNEKFTDFLIERFNK